MTLLMGSEILGAKVLGVILVGMSEISTFSCFGVKLTIADCVSRDVVVVDSSGELEMVEKGVCGEKNHEILRNLIFCSDNFRVFSVFGERCD